MKLPVEEVQKRLSVIEGNVRKVIDWCKESPNLTRNEKEALTILVNLCLEYPELRHAMTMIRGHKVENIIKKYFRANPLKDDINYQTKEEKGIGE